MMIEMVAAVILGGIVGYFIHKVQMWVRNQIDAHRMCDCDNSAFPVREDHKAGDQRFCRHGVRYELARVDPSPGNDRGFIWCCLGPHDRRVSHNKR